MTENEQFEAILDVFTTEGWGFILEDAIKRKKAIDNVYDVQTLEELYRRKGEIETLDWMISLKEWYQYSQELSQAE